MKDQIQVIIKSVCRDLFHVDTDVDVTRPDPEFGDFSTNIALKLAKQLGKQPREVAETIADIINQEKNDLIEEVTVAGPGFINVTLTTEALYKSYNQATKINETNKDKQILVEFGNANPFKDMHLGHLYSAIEGDGISSLLESTGADVKRLSYHGDVGLNVARCVYGIGREIDWDLSKLDDALKAKPIGYYYAEGAKASEKSEEVAEEIKKINQHIYKKDDEKINKIYELGRKISFDQFDEIFRDLGIKHNKRYLESEASEIGQKTVEENIGKVFEKSDGAIVYKGEKVGLHTRVFINSQGLPTYEAKDLGLAELKDKDYPKADKSIYITAYEQMEYFKVMFAALKEINPRLAAKNVHISHGFLSLSSGKMSSRTGDVFTAENLIENVKAAIKGQYPDSEIKEEIFLAAIRYTFLRQRLGGDIVFDVKESVSLEGNSGPYIQYAHARARSILAKATDEKVAAELKIDQIPLEEPERRLAMKISQFSEIVERASTDYMPHHICTYLYELSQEFNSFYESNRVINNPRMFTRLHLVSVYAEVLKNGLKLLNIPAPMHM